MKLKVMIVALVVCLMTGCVSMRTSEKHEYQQLEARLDKAGLEPIVENKPGLAAALNVLPGFGNAYLEQWGAFIGNLLLWPVSIAWGAPQAYIDAKTINKQETLYFYKHGLGKEELAKKEADGNQ